MTIKWREPIHIEYADNNDDGDQYRPQPQYDDDDLDDIIDEDAPVETTQSLMSEAQARIEQANLYQTIINHELFGPNSARPEIMSLVENEIKTFAMSRLEILLGMKPDEQSRAPIQVESPFSETEIDALKAIAARLTRKPETQQERSPAFNSITASPPAPTPAIRQVVATKLPAPKPISTTKAAPKVATAKPKGYQVAKPVPSPGEDISYHTNATPAKPARKPRTPPVTNTGVSESKILPGKDYSQVVNPAAPPMKMPRDIHMGQPQGATGMGTMDQFMLGVAAEAIVKNKNVAD
jgi:hypothetical protein